MDEPRIETSEARTVVGMHRPMTLADHGIPALWRTFRTRLAEVEGRRGSDFLSMRVYGPLGGRPPGLDTPFEQWAAVEVEAGAPVPDGMARHALEGGRYAVFDYVGPAHDFGATARWIHGTWFPRSAWVLDDREQFEILPADYVPTDPGAREEIWLPVRPRSG